MKFNPSPRPTPLTDLHRIWYTWLCRGYLHMCKTSSRPLKWVA